MVPIDTVTRINKELQAFKNSVQLSTTEKFLFDKLIELTSLDETGSIQNETKIAGPIPVVPISNEIPKCPHKDLDIYGICRNCHECQHTNRHSQTGDCITCGKTFAELNPAAINASE